jgi:hypothetical protein
MNEMIQALEQRMLLAADAIETMVRLPDSFIARGRRVTGGPPAVRVVGDIPGNIGNRTTLTGIRALGTAGTGGTGVGGGVPGQAPAGGTGATRGGSSTADIAPNIPARARNLGTLTNGRRTVNESVGRGDRRDYFRFDAVEGQTLDLRFSSDNTALDVELYFDEDGDGQLVGTERITVLDSGGSTTRRLEQPLEESGTYYILVSGSGRRSDYTLSFRNLNDATPGDANELGVIDGFRGVRDELGATDREDVFAFTLDERTDLLARLTQLSRNADLALYRDADSDGDLGEEELVAESARGGRRSERISARLDAGDYFAVVSGAGARETDYRLILSATPAAGNVNEIDLEDLGTEAIRQTGSLSQGDADVYLFTGGGEQEMTFSLSGLSDDADLLLYSGGSAGAFDAGNLVASSRNGDDADEEITLSLGDGEYALVVDARQETDYVLEITPVTT